MEDNRRCYQVHRTAAGKAQRIHDMRSCYPESELERLANLYWGGIWSASPEAAVRFIAHHMSEPVENFYAVPQEPQPENSDGN